MSVHRNSKENYDDAKKRGMVESRNKKIYLFFSARPGQAFTVRECARELDFTDKQKVQPFISTMITHGMLVDTGIRVREPEACNNPVMLVTWSGAPYTKCSSKGKKKKLHVCSRFTPVEAGEYYHGAKVGAPFDVVHVVDLMGELWAVEFGKKVEDVGGWWGPKLRVPTYPPGVKEDE